MAVAPGFKAQPQSSSTAPFLAPPTIDHSCQHSGQVWPPGVEPIISKLFWTPLQIPVWGPPLGCTLLLPHCNPEFLRLPSCSTRFIHTWMWDLPVCQPPPCCKSFLPSSAPSTGLYECFFFNSLCVGLLYSLIFCQFWLFFLFKFVVVLLLVV